jgi:hypothetical protein
MSNGQPVTLAECMQNPYSGAMAPNILMRNVPTEVHQVLVARATQAGQSLQEYLLSLVQELTQRPTAAEIMQALAQSLPVGDSTGETSEDVLEIITQGRQERDDREW